MTRPRFADVDAVTIDGYGTLLTLSDPVAHLDRELRARGIEVGRDEIERGFRAEVDYYARTKLSARDDESVARLRVGCAEAFAGELALEVDPEELAAAFAFEFELLPGVTEALEALRARGLALAVVANWDFSLHALLRRHGLSHRFAAIVTSAEIGAAKPDVRPFAAALDRLGVEPARAVHVGDHAMDEEGAAAAGMRFVPVPLSTAFRDWS